MPLMYDYAKISRRLPFWPETEPVDNTDIGLMTPDGTRFIDVLELGKEWTGLPRRANVCRDGSISIRRREEPFNGVAIPVAYARRKRDLEHAQWALCTLYHRRDKRLTLEDGRRYRWNGWLPGTLWQLSAVARVMHLFLQDDHDQAVRELVRLSRLVEEAAARDRLQLSAPSDATPKRKAMRP